MQSENGGMTIKWLLLFSALPGGYRDYDGTFLFQSFYGRWWSATEVDLWEAWLHDLHCSCDYLSRFSYYHKSCGFSVRLVKD